MSARGTLTQPAASSPAADVVAVLTTLGENVFAAVDRLRGTVEALLAAHPTPLQRELAPLEEPTRDILQRVHGAVIGAGFVAAPGLLADGAHWLEWWSVDDHQHQVTRLAFETDIRADGFRDYTVLPWFASPQRSGVRHVTGPYVDYLCTDEYTLTFTAPVTGPSGFAGVVGCDVPVRRAERLLLPPLRALGAPAAVVNAENRVLVGNRPDLVTGALLRDVGPSTTGHACPTLPFSLLVRPT